MQVKLTKLDIPVSWHGICVCERHENRPCYLRVHRNPVRI